MDKLSETQTFIYIKQKNNEIYLVKLRAKTLVRISYAAVRGETEEEGAVQRVLNTRRIAKLKKYAIDVGEYPNSIVLNWVGDMPHIDRSSGEITIPLFDKSAQIIDGQHRIAGLRAAIHEKPSVGEIEIPVAMFIGLNTKECANIFLSINTEQKPAPPSLVYDLYGIASDTLVDQAAARAKDIASELNESEESPYHELIKFPGAPRTWGGVALSTVVTALKPLVLEKGVFDQIGLTSLEQQKRAVINYFQAIKNQYGLQWQEKNNAFLYAAGFSGALEFFKNKLVHYCNSQKSFTIETIDRVLKFDKSNLIYQSDLKGLQGTKANNKVAELLAERFEIDREIRQNFEF